MDCGCRMFKSSEMSGKEERLTPICPECFINGIAKQQTVIQDRDLCVFRRCDYAVDVDVDTGLHSSRARSHNRRCFSDFDIRPDVWISGRRPKLIFIGAKCFCGVETYRHNAPIAVSSGKTIGSSPLAVRTALMPATSPEATFSM